MIVVAATAVVTACGGTESESTAGTTAPATSSSALPPISEPTTPAGTDLAVGERAVVDYDNGLDQGLLAITVTAIEQADRSEFRAEFGDDAEGMTPYCIRYTVENLSGADFSTKNPPQLSAQLDDGGPTGTFIMGSIPSCTEKRSPSDFNYPGARYETAKLQAAAEGDTVVAATYDGNDDDGNPLVWRTSSQ